MNGLAILLRTTVFSDPDSSTVWSMNPFLLGLHLTGLRFTEWARHCTVRWWPNRVCLWMGVKRPGAGQALASYLKRSCSLWKALRTLMQNRGEQSHACFAALGEPVCSLSSYSDHQVRDWGPCRVFRLSSADDGRHHGRVGSLLIIISTKQP